MRHHQPVIGQMDGGVGVWLHRGSQVANTTGFSKVTVASRLSATLDRWR